MGYIPGGEREMKYNVEKMIAELCPTGVLYCEMGKLAQIGTGKSNGNEAEDNGEYPFFIRSPIVKRKNCYEYDEEAIIIPGEGGVGDIFHYINGKYALHQRVYRIHFTTKDVDTRFMYYYLSANFKVFIQRKAVNATVTSIRKPMIEQFPIPLPPLPIQQEIVRILDTFTNLTAELTNKLNAELTARRKQYEYYRDELLTFGEDVPRMTLKDISVSVSSGKNKEKEQEGMYPVYGSTGVIGRTNTAKYSKEQILVARVGANAGFVHKANGTYDVSDNTIIVELKDNYNLQYVYYILQKMNLRKYAKGGGQPLVTAGELKKIEIPIPDINEQDRVVSILDKFTGISTSFDSGLPAEIAARQKQYEYYRERLLSFKESHR